MEKIKTYSLLLILPLVIVSCGLNNSVNTPEYNPSIKSESVWSVNPETGIKLLLKSEKEFSRDGNLTFWSVYNEEGILDFTSEYSYAGNKSVETKSKFNTSGGIDSMIKIEYTFNKSGKLTEKFTFNEEGYLINKIEYNYDQNGNITQKTVYDSSGEVSSSVRYENSYNTNGNLIERFIYNDNNTEYSRRDSVSYSPGGGSVEIIKFGGNGEINLIKTFIYYPEGNVKFEIESKSDGTIVRKYLYEYTFYS